MSPRDTRGCKQFPFIGFATSLAKFSTIPPSPAKNHASHCNQPQTMSRATTDLSKEEYKSANGSPEKIIGEPEVRNEEEEGEESDDDDYEEIDDEVCVQGNITKIWEFNPF